MEKTVKKEFNFNKEKSTIIKGIAIILMIVHHLFAFPDRIQTPSYYLSMPILNNNIAYYIGVFGRICVAIYLFISGYGLYLKYEKEKNFKWVVGNIKNFIINYWLIIFFIFIPFGLVLKKYTVDIKELVLNLTCIKISFISSWWFIRVYFELLILFPIVIKLVDDNLISSFIKVIIIPVVLTILRENINIISNPIINIAFEVISYMPLFMSGILFSKFNIFTRVDQVLNKKILITLF